MRWNGQGNLNTDKSFTSQRDDSYIKLLDYGSRQYDPELGRFIQPDSIVPDPTDPVSYDRYAYVGYNPINRNDPTGHCWGVASGIRGLPTYDTTCANLDMALTIVQSDQATIGQRAGAAAYIGAEGIAHAALVTGSIACISNIELCLTGAKAALGFGGAAEAACADGDCTNEVKGVNSALDAIGKLTGNAKGTAYEEWVKKVTGGEGSFKLPGAQYDNKVGQVLMEMKSWDWKNVTAESKAFMDIQNQIGRASAIATQNGYQYLVPIRKLN